MVPAALEAPLGVKTSVKDWQRGGKGVKKTRRYIDCNFILGSVAEVERVFIAPKYVLSENKAFHGSPSVLNAIMILKLNSRF